MLIQDPKLVMNLVHSKNSRKASVAGPERTKGRLTQGKSEKWVGARSYKTLQAYEVLK